MQSVEKVHGSLDGNLYNFMEIESMEVFRHVSTGLCRRVRRSLTGHSGPTLNFDLSWSCRYSLRRIANKSFNPSNSSRDIFL